MRARIRTVKPEIFLDEELWDLGQETGLPVLQAFEGLWCYADREGRFVWRPRALKPLILPYWDGDMSHVLDALWSRRFLVRYTSSTGQDLGAVRTFKRHQLLNNRETPSELPDIATCEARVPDATSTRYVPAQAVWVRSGSGNGSGNGLGREGESEGEPAPVPVAKPKKAKPRTSVPEYLDPNAATLACEQESGASIQEQWPQFHDYHLREATLSADWQASLRTWLRNAKTFSRGRHGPANAIHPSGLGTQKQVARVMQFMKEEQESEKK